MCMEDSDAKEKAQLRAVGHSLYRACDYNAQYMLRQAQVSNILTLNGSTDDPTLEKLVDRILNVILKDTPSELLSREVYLLTAIKT